jgi:hypothetical protein
LQCAYNRCERNEGKRDQQPLVVVGSPRLDLPLLQLAVSVSTLSWLAGFLTPFNPGGVGVREGVIVLLLGAVMAAPQAILVARLARVLALAAELAFAGAVFIPLRAARTVAIGSTNPAVP